VKLPKIDPDAMDFLKSTLRYEPSARATCDELLAHPFFEGFEEWFAPVCLDAVDFC
jgi:serine/threonine protein kinase